MPDNERQGVIIGSFDSSDAFRPSSTKVIGGDTIGTLPVTLQYGTIGTVVTRDTEPYSVSLSGIQDTRIAALTRDLDAVRGQLASIQREASLNAAVTEQVKTVASLVEQVQANSKKLMAPVLLPPMEDMEVRLVASHSLERLEEYRSDENKYYLFIGLFGGAILGILSNWFTSAQFTITRFSLVFIALLAILTLACVFMVTGISRRAKGLRTKLLSAEARPTLTRESQETE